MLGIATRSSFTPDDGRCDYQGLDFVLHLEELSFDTTGSNVIILTDLFCFDHVNPFVRDHLPTGHLAGFIRPTADCPDIESVYGSDHFTAIVKRYPRIRLGQLTDEEEPEPEPEKTEDAEFYWLSIDHFDESHAVIRIQSRPDETIQMPNHIIDREPILRATAAPTRDPCIVWQFRPLYGSLAPNPRAITPESQFQIVLEVEIEFRIAEPETVNWILALSTDSSYESSKFMSPNLILLHLERDVATRYRYRYHLPFAPMNFATTRLWGRIYVFDGNTMIYGPPLTSMALPLEKLRSTPRFYETTMQFPFCGIRSYETGTGENQIFIWFRFRFPGAFQLADGAPTAFDLVLEWGSLTDGELTHHLSCRLDEGCIEVYPTKKGDPHSYAGILLGPFDDLGTSQTFSRSFVRIWIPASNLLIYSVPPQSARPIRQRRRIATCAHCGKEIREAIKWSLQRKHQHSRMRLATGDDLVRQTSRPGLKTPWRRWLAWFIHCQCIYHLGCLRDSLPGTRPNGCPNCCRSSDPSRTKLFRPGQKVIYVIPSAIAHTTYHISQDDLLEAKLSLTEANIHFRMIE